MSQSQVRNVNLRGETHTGPKGSVTVLASATLLVHRSLLKQHFRVNPAFAFVVPELGEFTVVKVELKEFRNTAGEITGRRVDFPEIRIHGAVKYVPIAHPTTAQCREYLTKLVNHAFIQRVKELTAA